jgi:hypothetical protein
MRTQSGLRKKGRELLHYRSEGCKWWKSSEDTWV